MVEMIESLNMKNILLAAGLLLSLALNPLLRADPIYTPPASPHADYNFNPGWKFFQGDVTNAEQATFDDSAWSSVSAPHTYNDTDTYDEIISHSGGERHQYMGIAWYRKHFKLPAAAKGAVTFASS